MPALVLLQPAMPEPIDQQDFKQSTCSVLQMGCGQQIDIAWSAIKKVQIIVTYQACGRVFADSQRCLGQSCNHPRTHKDVMSTLVQILQARRCPGCTATTLQYPCLFMRSQGYPKAGKVLGLFLASSSRTASGSRSPKVCLRKPGCSFRPARECPL